MGIVLGVMVIFYCYLSGQIHSDRIGNFGVLFGGKVTEPYPIVVAATNREGELVIIDFGLKFHVWDEI